MVNPVRNRDGGNPQAVGAVDRVDDQLAIRPDPTNWYRSPRSLRALALPLEVVLVALV